MPSKPSHKKALLGDTDGNLSELLDDVVNELGGKQGLAVHLAKHLKDDKANPYLQSRAFQTLVRLMDKVDSRAPGEAGVLSDDELESEIMVGLLRFLVPMPEDMYQSVMAAVQEKRDAYSQREAKARLAKENATRPIGVSAIPGIEKSA